MPATPTSRLEGLTTSIAEKAPVRVATTAAITLENEQTIDGVAVVEGDRVLVKNQADPLENGIYNCLANEAWERAKDFNGTLDCVGGTWVRVVSGTINALTGWYAIGNRQLIPGTDDIEFAVWPNNIPDDDSEQTYLIHGQFLGIPSVLDVMMGHVFDRDVSLPANLDAGANFYVRCVTNPATTFVCSMQLDGVEFGTISITSAGAVTVSSTAQTPGANVLFTVVADDDATTAEDIFLTIAVETV